MSQYKCSSRRVTRPFHARGLSSSLLLLALGVFSPLTAGCDATIKTNDTDIQQLAMYKDLRTVMDDKKKQPVVLVDPRTPAKYAAGHADGAINLPLATIDKNMKELAVAKTIVVVAGGWTDPLAPATAKKLMALGYQGVYDFRGGVELWKAEGQRVVSTTPPATNPASGK